MFIAEFLVIWSRGVYGTTPDMSLSRHCPNHASLPRRDDKASTDRPCLRLAMNRGSVRVRRPIREERAHGDRYGEKVQCNEGLRVIQPEAGGADVFVHISAVERAGMRELNEGQQITYEVVADRRTGRSSADNLKPA